jgi:hypothetical protein
MSWITDWIKASFTNLDWRWPNEPVLYMAFAVAILNIAIGLINGSLDFTQAWETLLIAIGAFAARGKVSPVPAE